MVFICETESESILAQMIKFEVYILKFNRKNWGKA